MYPASEPVGRGGRSAGSRRQPRAAAGSRGLNGKSIVMTQDAFKKVTPLKFKKTQLSMVNGFEKYAVVNGWSATLFVLAN